MSALSGVLKPCYVFAPRVLARRVRLQLFGLHSPEQTVSLPWGARLEVNANEGIGRELVRQNLFDIAVTEACWRLLRPGDLAVDVGANVGYLTSLFAARVGSHGSVVSFEPHPRIFERLSRNTRNFRQDPDTARIQLHECALGDRDGTARLLQPEVFGINEGSSTVVPQAGASGGFDIRLTRLDTAIPDRDIALLKIDVEGFEGQVLAGAESLLKRGKIRHIIYEAHDCERSPLHALLGGFGYSVFGLGHHLFGLKMTAGDAAPAVDRRWESPSYLATLEPGVALRALRKRGWQVLQ